MFVSCYGMALKQQPSVSALWHDLGVCYYHLTKVVEGHLVKVVAGKCVDALKQALTLDPSNHAHWNAVGVAAAHKGQRPLFLAVFTSLSGGVQSIGISIFVCLSVFPSVCLCVRLHNLKTTRQILAGTEFFMHMAQSSLAAL